MANCNGCNKWKMAAELVATDNAFYGNAQELYLNMNDVWAWGTADAEHVKWEEIPEVYAIWEKDGSDGLLVWSCKKRNAKPQKPVFDNLKPEIQEQLKDLPRFGDTTVSVGDKAVTFDDGWM